MQKLNIIAVGKLEDSYKRACSEYNKRAGAFYNITETEVSEYRLGAESPSGIITGIERESAEIARRLRGFTVVTAVEGDMLTSEEFAKMLQKLAATEPEITFVVGGSHGLSSGLKASADMRLSFGSFTYPHQLLRVMLYEQIYRAGAINNNKKYHK